MKADVQPRITRHRRTRRTQEGQVSESSGKWEFHGLTSRIEQVETREILHPLAGAFTATLALVCPYIVAKVGKRDGIIATETDEYAIV